MPNSLLLNTAVLHLSTILTEVFAHGSETRALLVYDEQTALSRLLGTAYRQLLPDVHTIIFEQSEPAEILAALAALQPGALVILVQSTSFRLDAFRIRIHLFEQGLKVIEHPHLGRVRAEELEIYVAALAYDPAYYRALGPQLKARLDQANTVRLMNGEQTLVYQGPFEAAKLNIGDYTGMKNVGGQFPIGEVFTELRELTQLNGEVALFAFGDRNFSVFACERPIVLTIAAGRVVGVQHALPEFEAVLEEIRQHEGEIWVRELGFGLNRALTRERRICDDVGIYERMCGVHLSLGSKHALYPKAGFHKKKVKYHVDVFVEVAAVSIDGMIVYEHGNYVRP